MRMCNSYDFITMLVKNIILTLILSLPLFIFSQQDTIERETYYEEINTEEYFLLSNGNFYTYPQYGTLDEDVFDTLSKHIRENGIFTTNLDINLNINLLAATRRKYALADIRHSDSNRSVISDNIGDRKSENSIKLFCYIIADSLKHDFVLRKMDQIESCECSQSVFDETLDIEEITNALESPDLKWINYTYLQHCPNYGNRNDFIFIEYKMKWKIFSRNFTIILESNENK